MPHGPCGEEFRPSRFAVFLFCLLACAGCEPRPPLVLSGETMGTYYSVTIIDPVGTELAGRLAQSIEDTLAAVNGRMSTYLEDSELSLFNRLRDTGWQAASPQLVKVLLEARRVSALSGGAFDVTVGPVVNLWGFGPDPDVDDVPTVNAVARALAAVDYRNLEARASPPMIRKRVPRIYVDLSAIAKGYAVDEIVALLEAAGIRNSLVDVGGELYAGGVNADGGPWRIAIEKPVDGARTAMRSVEVSNAAVATSGDYRNYTEIGGRRYSHEIDPYSGRPVTHRTALVSVVAPTAMEADALATALLVLGRKSGLALAHRHGIAAYFVERTSAGLAPSSSPGFEARFPAFSPEFSDPQPDTENQP